MKPITAVAALAFAFNVTAKAQEDGPLHVPSEARAFMDSCKAKVTPEQLAQAGEAGVDRYCHCILGLLADYVTWNDNSYRATNGAWPNSFFDKAIAAAGQCNLTVFGIGR